MEKTKEMELIQNGIKNFSDEIITNRDELVELKLYISNLLHQETLDVESLVQALKDYTLIANETYKDNIELENAYMRERVNLGLMNDDERKSSLESLNKDKTSVYALEYQLRLFELLNFEQDNPEEILKLAKEFKIKSITEK